MRTLPLVLLAAACGNPHRYVASPAPMVAREPISTEDYHDWGKNPWIDAERDHLSTFAADVDTASFTIARKKLEDNQLPPAASVRVEEWVNYFRYAFPAPANGSVFSVAMDAAPHPFVDGRYVLRVGVATPEKTAAEREPANLVFLVDVSGSMNEPDKLPLAKQALRVLVNNLTDKDTVALVTYAGDSRVILPRTSIDHKDKILAAIDHLEPGGSTAMASGIDTAYEIAAQNVKPGSVSRVIVCTDGDANVGPHSHEEILKIIEARAKQGVTLSTIGFGMGNYKDTLMEQLADKGYGNNYYIDGIGQAERVFGEQLTATLEVAAKDVKLQVDFDPTIVSHYRLIGYENRDVADKDFRNDQVGGGQVGWGHQVTAMYELELAASARPAPFATVHIRHKAPEGDTSVEETFAMTTAPAPSLAAASQDLRFAFAVAALADVLRDNPDAKAWSLEAIRTLAADTAGSDKDRLALLGMLDHVRKLRGDSTKIAR